MNPESADFGWALNNLKQGKRVCRSGWNGKGMFVVVALSNSAPDGNFHKCNYPVDNFIWIKTAQNTYVPWVPCQSDILGEDWEVVE